MSTLCTTFLILVLPSVASLQAGDDREKKFDRVINRFIEYDTGKLPGPDGKQALAEFRELGPDAMSALIRGLNRAAKIEHSCPAVTIAKKLNTMLRASQSPGLLEFARENIGAGVTESRHMGVIKDLRLLCTLRRNSLLTRGVTDPDEPPEPARISTLETQPKRKRVRQMTTKELADAVATDRGLRLRMVLEELGKRDGDESINALGTAATTRDGDHQKLARELLQKHLDNLDTAALKAKLKDDRTEVKIAAARAAGTRSLRLAEPLIDLLSDSDDAVCRAAHDALKRIGKDQDFGPRSDADPAARKQAIQKWRAWLKAQSGR